MQVMYSLCFIVGIHENLCVCFIMCFVLNVITLARFRRLETIISLSAFTGTNYLSDELSFFPKFVQTDDPSLV